MFYEVLVKGHIRVPPKMFGEDTKQAILKSVNERFENFISKELGIVIGVTEVSSVGEGIIIPGDGAAYYDTKFKLLAFKPEMQEVVVGKVNEISDFGAFIDIGPLDGMVHISQTMDDYVTFSKSNVLTGKETKRSLKVGDICKARIIAVSYKDIGNPKIGLTMRQPGLGKEEWLKEEGKKIVVKEAKEEKVKEK
ncbi:MAG: DNA-directed RNA polymerase [Nanoarchaeota archaeon]